MFRELEPFLRHRAVLLTVTHLGEDQIRVNVVPKKLKDGENEALTTPLSVTGAAEELDTELPKTLIDYVGSHLRLKNSLESAKAQMDAAAKTAQDAARMKQDETKAKLKNAGKNAKSTGDQASAPKSTDVATPVEPPKPPAPKSPSLFDFPTTSAPATVAVPASPAVVSAAAKSTEDEILAEADENDAIHSRDVEDEAA